MGSKRSGKPIMNILFAILLNVLLVSSIAAAAPKDEHHPYQFVRSKRVPRSDVIGYVFYSVCQLGSNRKFVQNNMKKVANKTHTVKHYIGALLLFHK